MTAAVDEIRHWQSMTVEQKLDAIRREWEPNASATIIAARLHVTRQSIIGIYFRNRKSLADCPLRDPTSAQIRPQRRRVKPLPQPPKRKLIGYAGQETPKRLNATPQLTVERVSAPPHINEPSPLNIALADLSAKQCRWPCGDGPFTFCGHPADGTYCEFHARLGVGKGTPGERRADRVLRAEML